jgi:ABC-type transport system substrate-binding protein
LTEQLAFRRAVAHAIDKNRLYEAIYGHGVDSESVVLDSYVGIASPTLSPDSWAVYGHDPERARQLVTEACNAVGRDCGTQPPTVVFSTPEEQPFRVQLAELLVEYLAAAGIELIPALEDQETFFGDSGTIDEGRFELAEWGVIVVRGLDGLLSFQYDFHPGEPNNQRWGESSELSPAQQRVADLLDGETAEPMATISEIEQILADEVVFIPLWERPSFLVRRDCFVDGHGTDRNALGWPIHSWYLTEECR